MSSTHSEEKPSPILEKGNTRHDEMERIATVDIDNYDGIHVKTVLVYIVRLPALSKSVS